MLVKIVIPIYKLPLKPEEQASLENTIQKLAAHPITFLVPEVLDTKPLFKLYPQAEEMRVSNQWLGVERGITGYNEMTLSKDFYDRFSDCEYILICHTDAWIFRDELESWCRQGYDIVAAPWPTRPRYRKFPLKQYLCLKRKLAPKSKILHQDMFGRIGNGGLCLRRTEAFSNACKKYKTETQLFIAQSVENVLYNEDLFWALIPEEFNYPSVETALQFSFDLKPRLCYELNGGRLPMGCHGFNKPERMNFWQQFIP